MVPLVGRAAGETEGEKMLRDPLEIRIEIRQIGAYYAVSDPLTGKVLMVTKCPGFAGCFAGCIVRKVARSVARSVADDMFEEILHGGRS